MGYDVNRFTGEISEELICSICSEVLEYPLTTECEHLFCRDCINDWLRENRTCPIDRQYIHQRNLKSAPRTIRNLLGKLEIHCDYERDGCNKVVCLESLEKHASDCHFNPKTMLTCDKGCGRTMTREELRLHNCWSDIRRDMLSQQRIIANLTHQRTALVVVIALLLFYITCPWFLSKFFENVFFNLYDDQSET